MTLPTSPEQHPAWKEAPSKVYGVIASRKSGVAISWYAVRNRTIAQEIPTGFALGMTAVIGSCSV